MPHTLAIQQAFQHPLLQQIVGNAIELVPEIKHEGLVCTALAASLRGTQSEARRELKKSSRRKVDIYFTQDHTELEAKYHLDFDLPKVSNAVDNFSQVKKKVQRLGRAGSWNAGEAVIFELSRLGSGYFLWSICSRGTDAPNRICMETQRTKWLNGLAVNHQNDVHGHVQAELARLAGLIAQEMELTVTPLSEIRQGHSVLFSTLFRRAQG
ncbi:hypothetical protein [Roseateles sp. PN1]|uniref:hypothetical protein n=1 Tax=Roseateles sp. PN1 TaxID=3137372 RepID=UPI0031386CBC